MATFSTMQLNTFLEQTACDSPVPGGGGIAALAGALGAAMASMAANFTVDKPKFAEHQTLMRQTLDKLQPLIGRLAAGIDEDAVAFSAISAAYRLPKDDAGRAGAIQQALIGAMRTPLGILAACREAAELLPALAGAGNPNLLSDVEVAAIMLDAAARAARVNVLVNSGSLKTAEARDAEMKSLDDIARIGELAAETAATVRRRTSPAG